jgi:hypothetical protein
MRSLETFWRARRSERFCSFTAPCVYLGQGTCLVHHTPLFYHDLRVRKAFSLRLVSGELFCL